MDSNNSFLKIFIPVARSISALLEPHGEVVIHDLSTDTIFFICGNDSGRKSGDESLLGKTRFEVRGGDFFDPYLKSGNNGEPQRSVSAVLANEEGVPKGLLCINVDISELEQAKKIISGFLQIPQKNNQPEELFEFDWREQMNLQLSNFLKINNKKVRNMTRTERCQLTNTLKSKGLLEAKNSITHLADILNVTRATIYNYLNS